MAIFKDDIQPAVQVAVILVLLICLFVSLLLNFLTLIFNLQKSSKSLPRNLFLLLALTDMTTGTLGPIVFSLYILVDEVKLYEEHEKVPVMWYQVTTGTIHWMLNFTPCYITGFMTISRYITLRYPFYKIDMAKFMGVLCIFLILQVTLVLIYVLRGHFTGMLFWNSGAKCLWFGRIFGLSPVPKNIIWITSVFLVQVTAFIMSLLTIIHLATNKVRVSQYPSRETLESRRARMIRGSKRIVIMNMGSMFYITAYIVTGVFHNFLQHRSEVLLSIVYFSTMVMVPIITSAINPVIFIYYTPSITFKRLTSKWRASQTIDSN